MVKNRDKSAFIFIYNTYSQKIYNTAFFILKDYQYADDVVQETFLQVYLKIHKLHVAQAFETWLYKIAVSYCLKLLKNIKKTDMIVLDDNIDQFDGNELNIPDNLIIQKETKVKIRQYIYSLSIKHRVVLTLFYFNNMSIKDIANIIECSEGTVKSRLFYGKKILKDLLYKENNGNEKNILGDAVYEV